MEGMVNISEIFGSKVFDDATMRERLPKKIYAEFHESVDKGVEMDSHVAEIVANAMKDWAIENGATHYTHWFQPLTGVTAEKHESFISPIDNSHVLMEFSAKELIKGEADGSSLPSGGIRATFEARGYSSWDTTSPAFIHEYRNGAILCIPTIFCSYNGETLDKKTPLLRSCDAINKETLRLLRLLGDETTKKVTVNSGAEQEYFLVPKEDFDKRVDLIYAGRTLFGASAPKGQELDDHYFGVLSDQLAEYMNDLNQELWKIGVMAKTQHNEAAPAQHELVPIFEAANLASDHNQLVMETMKKVAVRHGLFCLLNEKPFNGINGSGKHNNWSITTDTGKNLLDPGKHKKENLIFLLIMACAVRAIDKFSPLLRVAISTAANDLRLGSDEAPPAVISIFLGEELENTLESYISGNGGRYSKYSEDINFGISSVPYVKKDSTDRNRTSPFAFTGNKFEFRMVGSMASVSDSTTVINMIFADSFKKAADFIEAAEDKKQAVHDIISKMYSEHKRVVFNGNNYSEEWHAEAARRGLPNINNTVDALDYLTWDKAVELYGEHNVLTRAELLSRQQIGYENYANTIKIEANCMIQMTKKEIIPAVVKYMDELAITKLRLEKNGLSSTAVENTLKEINYNLDNLYSQTEELEKVCTSFETAKTGRDKAIVSRDLLRPVMEELRTYADNLELLTDRSVWPFPTYGELLFNVL